MYKSKVLKHYTLPQGEKRVHGNTRRNDSHKWPGIYPLTEIPEDVFCK